MIQIENGVFHLKTDRFSYLFRVTAHGHLEQLHFGCPVSLEDAEAFACKPGLGWGTAVNYNADGTCLDVLPLEWSGSGRGDYRESPIELSGPQGAMATDFTYVNHAIHEGMVPMSLPQARDGGETLEVTLAHNDLILTLYYTAFDGVLTRRATLENRGKDLIWIHKLMSFHLDLPGDYEMTTFDGGWIAEMRPHRVSVGPGRIVHDSTTGASSNRHQPGFLLSEPGAGEDHGTAYGVNLIWSGNHYASAQQSFQGLTRIMQGVNPADFRVPLKPGEKFETPEALLAWSDRGFNGLSARMHDFINRHIVPQYWRNRPRPVLYNSWEGCMFRFDQNKLLSLAKKARELGCELFVLDDGWFGQRNDDKAGLGDYTVNKKKLPDGLEGLGQKLNGLGLEFGLWFEPESVNPDSDLYRAHPEWALTDDLPPVYGRNQLLLDLTKGEVRDYIVESVSGILDRANITYVKWDMNRHSTALGRKAYQYTLGLYEILDRIFTPRPQVLLETCSSGGNRFDLGMLCFGPQIWCSDDTDPVERITIQGSLSYLYPLSTMGAHVSAAPHAQTLRNTPLTTRGNVSFFGLLGYELDLNHLLPVEEVEIRNQIEFYKQYRKVFQFGRFRRDGASWQVHGKGICLAGLFHGLQNAAPGYERLRVKGLKPDKRYTVTSRVQKLRVGQFGALLTHIAPIAIDPNGALLRTADRRYGMEDGETHLEASGAALKSGVMLTSRFTGTGYDQQLRVQADFGSQLFVIKEETP